MIIPFVTLDVVRTGPVS